MYIRKVNIENIRSIDQFQMTFPEDKEAGWHVLIGDNGSGKSTIVRSVALALLEQQDIIATREDWENWLANNKKSGQIAVSVVKNPEYDSDGSFNQDGDLLVNKISFIEHFEPHPSDDTYNEEDLNSGIFNLRFLGVGYTTISEIITRNRTVFKRDSQAEIFSLDLRKGAWFSVAYGPFRRFSGGNPEKEKLYNTNPRLGAHLSVFGEDVALSESLTYLRELYIKDSDNQLKERVNSPEGSILKSIIKFVNGASLLPHDTIIDQLSPNQVTFKDANGNQVSATQMSDGYRSILSMTFELIRQLTTFYGYKAVFSQIDQSNMIIDLPGVVLIDEIDAHLHPTWQTRIGQWFTQYFPNLQFIVTTHSPLVCRAAEKGSIWRLAAPGSQQTSGEITGVERDRLIFGNVLDAYGTEAFGQDVERSDTSKDKLQQLAHLSQLNAYGQISDDQKKELQELRKILITDDTTEF